MKSKAKFFGVAALLFCLLLLAACSGSETDAPPSSPATDVLPSSAPATEETEGIYTIDGKKVLDVFAGIKLNFYGANGYGHVGFEDPRLLNTEFDVDGFYFKHWDDEEKKHPDIYDYRTLKVIYDYKQICIVTYDIEKTSRLSEGDVVVVTAEIRWLSDDFDFESTGYIPMAQKEFVVPALGEFVDSKNDVTSEMIEDIKKSVSEDLETDVAFLDGYFVTAVPGTDVQGDSPYSIMFAFNVDGKYYFCKVYNLVVRDDGSFEYDQGYFRTDNDMNGLASFEKSTGFDSLSEAISTLKTELGSSYTYENIDC